MFSPLIVERVKFPANTNPNLLLCVKAVSINANAMCIRIWRGSLCVSKQYQPLSWSTSSPNLRFSSFNLRRHGHKVAAYPVYAQGSWRSVTEARHNLYDSGFLRGFGIFDYLRIVNGVPVFLADHLARFSKTAKKMGIHHNHTEASLIDIIKEVVVFSRDPCIGVRIVLTGGVSASGFEPSSESELFVLVAPFAFADPARGVALMSREYVRDMPDIKTLNYAFALRCWPAVKASGADDLLYHTPELGVSESSRSNLFYVKVWKRHISLPCLICGQHRLLPLCRSAHRLLL